MKLIYQDAYIVVAVKPPRVLSTDEPGGMPDLVREVLGNPRADVRTVHRLDRVVGGLMVLARTAEAASKLSRQIRENVFEKEYLAVIHGTPDALDGRLLDLLRRDKARKMTFVVQAAGKDVQTAALRYQVLAQGEGMSRVRIQLETGRTHQIRVQFASRQLPLVGERKYSDREDSCELALWSCRLAFHHPESGEWMDFSLDPPQTYPWTAC